MKSGHSEPSLVFEANPATRPERARPKTFVSDSSADPDSYAVWIAHGERLAESIQAVSRVLSHMWVSERKEPVMRSLITALAMVAIATASFAIGRSTSGPGAGPAAGPGAAASIDTARLQSVARNLPELGADPPY